MLHSSYYYLLRGLEVEYRLIRASGLRVVYRNGVVAVDGVDIVLREGVVTGVIGPNGAGKSSLLKAIAGLIQYNGLVYIDGYEVSRTPYRVLARLISYTSSISVPEMLSYTVYEALLLSRYPLSRGFFETSEDEAIVERILVETGLEGLADRRLSELSSGELQRVLFAMAIARDPRYLLLDEPDNHLDLRGKAWVSMFIKKFSRGRVVVLSTHDLLFAFNTVDYIVLLDHGRIVYSGYRDDVLGASELFEKVYGVRILFKRDNGRVYPIPLYEIVS